MKVNSKVQNLNERYLRMHATAFISNRVTTTSESIRIITLLVLSSLHTGGSGVKLDDGPDLKLFIKGPE